MIVNADDFGYSDVRNDAIVRAFREGLISSATLMSTRDSYLGACELVHSVGLERHVGLHLVLTEDVPVTEACRRCPSLCDAEGRFRPELDTGRLLRAGPSERAVVYAELRAQAERLRAERVPLTHIDSHHHTHAHPAVIGLVVALARELDVRAVRLARNCDPRTGVPRRAVHAYVNARIRRAGLAATRWFGRVEDYVALQASDADDIEVMTHPSLRDGLLVDMGGRPLADYVAPLAAAAPFVSYAGEPVSVA